MRFGIAHPVLKDPQQQRVNEDLLRAVNTIGQFLFFGFGNPQTLTGSRAPILPVDANGNPVPALYIRIDGGPSSTFHVYDTATPGWTAK